MEFKKSNIEIINRLHQLSWLKKQDHLDKPEETMGKRGKRNQKRTDQKSSKPSSSYPGLVEEKEEPEVEQVVSPANNVWLKDDSASAAVVLFPEAMEKNRQLENFELDEGEQIEMAVMLSMIMAKEEGYESPTKTKVKSEGYLVIDDDGDSEWGAKKGNLPTNLEEPESKVAPQGKIVTKTNPPRESLEDFNKRLLLNPGSSKVEDGSAGQKRKYQAQEDRKIQISKKEERKKVGFASEVMDKENSSLNKYPVSPKPKSLNIDEEEDFSFVKPVVEKVKKGLQVIEEEDSVAGTDEERSSVNGDPEVVEVKGQRDVVEEIKVQNVVEGKGMEETSGSVESKNQEESSEVKGQEEIPEEVNVQVVSEENVLEENSASEVKVQDVLPEEKGQDDNLIPEVEVEEVIEPEEKVQEDIPEEIVQDEPSNLEVKGQEVVPEEKHLEETSNPEVKVQEIVPEEKVKEETPDPEVKGQESVPEERDLEEAIIIETIEDSLEDAHQEIPSSDIETKEQVPEENSRESEILFVQEEEVQPEVSDSKIEETSQVSDSKTEETLGSDFKSGEKPEDVVEEKICEEKVADGIVQEPQLSDEISAGEIVELKDGIQNDSKILETSPEEKEEEVIPETAAKLDKEGKGKEETDDQKMEDLEEAGPGDKLEQGTPEHKKEEEAGGNVLRESRIPTRSRPICRVQNSEERYSCNRENVQQMKNPFGFNKNPPRNSAMFPKDNSRHTMFPRDNPQGQKPPSMFPPTGRRDRSFKHSREPTRNFHEISGGPPRDSRPRDSEKPEPRSNERSNETSQQGREPRSTFKDSRQFRDNDTREPRANFRVSRSFRDAEQKPREHQDQSQRQGSDSKEPRATFRDSRGFRGPRDRWGRDHRCAKPETDKVEKSQLEEKVDGKKVDLQEGQKVEQAPPAKIPSQEVPQAHTILSSDSVEFVPNSQKKENPQGIRPLVQEEPTKTPKEQLQPSTAEFVPQYDRAPYREISEASSEAYKMAPGEETYKMAPVYRHPVDYYSPPPHYKIPQQFYRPSDYVARYPHFVQGYPPEGLYSPEGYPQRMANYAFEAPEFPRPPLPKPRDPKNYPRQNQEATNRYHPSQAFEGKEHQGYYKQQTSLLGSPPRAPPGFYQRAPLQKSFGHVGERRGEKRGGPNDRSGYADREMMGGCEERPLISPKTLMTTQFEAPPLQLHVREPNPGQGNRNMPKVCAGRGRGYSATKMPFPRRYNN